MHPIYLRLFIGASIMAALLFALCIDKIADRAKAKRLAERERAFKALTPADRKWVNNYGRD